MGKLEAVLKSLHRLNELSEPVPEHLKPQLDKYFDLYANVDPQMSRKEKDIFMLNSYLMLADLKLDDGTFDKITSGDDNVVEIYDLQYAQLFRSIAFLQFQTYSLITLMSKSNLELYAREEKYIPALLAQVQYAIQNRALTKFNIPAHKVWEKADGASLDYHWLMKLGFCAPVYSAVSGEVQGLVITHNTVQIFSAPFQRAPLSLVKNP